jgi:phage terminase small subunit
MKKELSPKQQRFVAEYLIDQNASQAAIRSGYSKKNPNVNGPRLLANAGIRAEIDKRLAKVTEKAEIEAIDVIREWKRIGLSDISQMTDANGNLLPLREMPEDIRRTISSIEIEKGKRKIRLWDKNSALTNLGKYFKLITDRPEVNLDISFADLLRAAREKRLAKLKQK